MNKKEDQVQKLIADFPWLLNLNYETIPSLKNKGLEYIISDMKRIDLLLKDKLSDRPVIIEFKATPFYRENIGQILEYRARILSEMNKEDSELNNIFGNLLSAPILILVVPKYDTEGARIACNLSGIDIYEYENKIEEFYKPQKRQTLEDIKKTLDQSILPVTVDRKKHVTKLAKDINTVLKELNLESGYLKFRNSSNYHSALVNFFINFWLFSENIVSIGIFEDIFNDPGHLLVFEFYSRDKKAIIKFKQYFRKKADKLKLQETIKDENPDTTEYYLSYYVIGTSKNP